MLLFTLTERVKTMTRLVLETCKNNDQAGSRGGCGVFWGENHDLNCSDPLLGDKQTNNSANVRRSHSIVSSDRSQNMTVAI